MIYVAKQKFDAAINGKLKTFKKGDDVSDVMISKFGIVFLKFDSMEEMLTKTEQMQELIHVL